MNHNHGVAPPEPFRAAAPNDDGIVPHRQEVDLFAMICREAREMSHCQRVRGEAKQLLPELAGAGGLNEEDLVNLMCGDVDQLGAVLQGPLEGGAFAVYVAF